MKRTLGWICGLLMMAVLLAGCTDGGKTPSALLEQVGITEYHVDDNGILYAEVTLPDYSRYMGECMAEAEEKAKDADDFETKLYQLVEERVKDDADTCSRTLEISLFTQNPEKETGDWSEDDIEELIRQEAFAEEELEFSLEILQDTAPEDYTLTGEAEQ